MKIVTKTPQKSLDKGLLRFRPKSGDFEKFKLAFAVLLSKIDNKELEDNQKTHVHDFLRDAFYKGTNEINSKGRIDLVVHLGPDRSSPVGLIVEAKSPGNKPQMVSVAKPNVKALRELVLYYMRERVEAKNDEIKYLIATNINEWFVFEASDFDEAFYRNRKFRKRYEDWRDSQLVNSNTDHFYNEIAKPFIDALTKEFSCTHFDLREYSKSPGEPKLIALYKLLSPYHLLKVKFTDDSNTLDKKFYTELLHIIGLEEYKVKSKTLIRRKPDKLDGTLIEKAIAKLETEYFVFDQTGWKKYGDNNADQIYNAALELCIFWTNRVLFLKLLESQLLGYHDGDAAYKFLNKDKVNNFNELSRLFHDVLNCPVDERQANVKAHYPSVPYLNSSLFDFAEVEIDTIRIHALDDNGELSVPNTSILRKLGEKAESLPTLQYLFRFLDAYDFASEGKEEIQSENRSLINASVLGKVFEKINGYKDGSIYTPGFITMYMCRQAIRFAVVQKFNDESDFDGADFDELTNWIKGRNYQKDNISRFNEIIDSLKICDPAVGSGHFLVSALNEMLAIKSELGIFADEEHRTFGDYSVAIANDELIITDRENNLFDYKVRDGKPLNAEIQRLQSTLFHEKQRLIENCLFGVDINPNSVKICRLRLWIELLKNAYYKGTELETLPNIDINIKEGNSLISRYSLNDKFKTKKTKEIIEAYREFTTESKNVKDKSRKEELKQLIREMRRSLSSSLDDETTKKKEELVKKQARLSQFENPELFDKYTDYARESKSKALIAEIAKAKVELEKIELKYSNAFEWRFEFPEILDVDGGFVGFNVVIGNPPYGVSLKGDLREAVVKCQGKVPDFEIFYFFTNLSHKIVNSTGIQSFIIPNTILFNVYAREYRKALLDSWQIHELLDCTDFDIFVGSATVRNVITLLGKVQPQSLKKKHIGYRPTADAQSFDELASRERASIDRTTLLANNQNWALVFRLDETTLLLTSKIRRGKQSLIELFPATSQGLIAYDQYQGQDEVTIKSRAYHSFEKKEHLKHWLWGEDVTRYAVKWNGKEFIDYSDGIANPREPHFFNGPRVLVREITNPRIYAAYTDEELYNDPAVLVVTNIGNDSYSLKVLLAILNSSLATFYHFSSSPKATKGAFPKILVDDINSFPLPIVSSKQQSLMEDIVDQILDQKKSGGDTTELERRIDAMVYELYDLTPDEIAIVENA